MNLNKKLIDLLGVTGLPVEPYEYTGKSDKYIVFVYESERPVMFADNTITDDTARLQVQLITPKNYNHFKLKKEIRTLLEGADFLVTGIREILGTVYVGTEKIRQTVFEVTYTEHRKMEDN